MPLTNSPSKKALGSNISEFHTGPTFARTAAKFGKTTANKQAIAVGLDIQRRAKKRKFADGGGVDKSSSIKLRSKQEYDQYAQRAMENGDDIMPFEAWTAKNAITAPSPDAAPIPATTIAPTAPGTGIVDRIRSMFKFADGGGVDTQLLDPAYYQSDLIPAATAQRAALGAGDRMTNQAMGAGTDADSRARLARLQALIARMRGGQGMGEEAAPVGGRQELFDRMRAMNSGTRQYAGGGGVHHVDPEENGGFTHEVGSDTYSYADGGTVGPLGGQPMPGGPQPQPGLPPPPAQQAVGALGNLGQQLLAERQALQQTYQIPPSTPPTPQPQQPMGGPPGAVGITPPGASLPGMSPGGPPPSSAVGAGLARGPQNVQAMLAAALAHRRPGMAAGGSVDHGNLMRFALRDPRVAMKYCGGGPAVRYAFGGPVQLPGAQPSMPMAPHAMHRAHRLHTHLPGASGARPMALPPAAAAAPTPLDPSAMGAPPPPPAFDTGGPVVARPIPSDDDLAKLQRLMVGLRASQAGKGNFGPPPPPIRGGVTFRG